MDVVRAGALALVLVLLVIGGVLVFRDYAAMSDAPEPLDDRGGVFVLLDRPGVPVSTEVVVRDSKLELRLEVGKGYAGQEVGYSLVLTGSGTAVGPDGASCPAGITSATPVSCHPAQLDPELAFASPEQPMDAQVVAGRITRGDDGMRTELTIDTGRRFAQLDGKRTYFGLPAIGTAYLAPDERRTVSFAVGSDKAFVPERLDLSVDYGDLPVTQRAETVSPEPWIAGSLFWFAEDAATVKARGALVDAVTEDHEERTLFLVGLYVGLATAFVPLLLPALWRSGQRLRRSRD
ncbi:hypothetical protein [Kribbella sp. NPDC051770]|uniref:hypothetical protein n=1 Tax=Kribbella sp. NPDC051770 TaxID=3155413 RepID=UPI00342C18BD